MSKRKNVIRVGDKVRIVNPYIFQRVGYPLDTQIVKESHITEEQKQLMRGLLRTVGLNYNFSSTRYDNEYEKLEHVFATILLKSKGFGGNERSVHTEHKLEYKDKICEVISKRQVKVGTYCPARSSQGYYDMYPEYEPAYLKDEKTVVIYKVYIPSNNMEISDYIEFPQSSVEKIKPEPETYTFDFSNMKPSENSDPF